MSYHKNKGWINTFRLCVKVKSFSKSYVKFIIFHIIQLCSPFLEMFGGLYIWLTVYRMKINAFSLFLIASIVRKYE